MSKLSGILGIEDLDTRLIRLEESVVYDAVRELSARHDAERRAAFNFFVQDTTTDYKRLYKLPGGDYMEPLDAQGRPAEQRPTGQWDTSYPLHTYGTAVGWDQETYAYMTAEDLDNLFESAVIADSKTHRREILRAIFRDTNATFVDKRAGSLTIRRLANGDGTTYPATMFSDSEADDDHYLHTGYTSANISDANNPGSLIRGELKEHWDGPYRFVALVNSAQRAKLKGLASFRDPKSPGVSDGDDVSRAIEATGITIPGEFLGVDEEWGVWYYEWDWIPADYLFVRDINRPAPLRQRQHVPEELRGFQLAADVEEWPLFKRTWVDRMGYGAGNRLNGLMLQFHASAYSIPAGY